VRRKTRLEVTTLLGSVALAALIVTSLGYRGFFTEAHQLREPRTAD